MTRLASRAGAFWRKRRPSPAQPVLPARFRAASRRNSDWNLATLLVRVPRCVTRALLMRRCARARFCTPQISNVVLPEALLLLMQARLQSSLDEAQRHVSGSVPANE